MSSIKGVIERAVRGEGRPVRLCKDDQANEAIILLVAEVAALRKRLVATEASIVWLRGEVGGLP